MEKRNLTAKLEGDTAIMADVLITALRIDGAKKTDKDTKLIEISLKSLEKTINDVKVATGKTYPSYLDILNFLTKNGDNKHLL